MKIIMTPSTSNLTKRFDKELKLLLMEDIKAFRTKTQFLTGNHRAIQQQQLSAA